MNTKTVKPEIQGDKVVLREWVGEEPHKSRLIGRSYKVTKEWIDWELKLLSAPTYEHHPDHESYFRERIGVKTDVEIVRGYIDEGKFYTITDSVGDTERGEYAIPKQEDDLWGDLLDYIEKFGKHLDREGMKTDLNFKYTIAKTTNNG